MPIQFLNMAMLLGLVAVSIPIIIHLLNRRRYDVVDWGAMQFLEISEVTRRRLLIEELLLMLLRMGLIALLVLALASPILTRKIVTGMGKRPDRDVVIVVDGSASMSYKPGKGLSTQDRATTWATTFLDKLQAGDKVALVQAKEQPITLAAPTHDLERVRENLRQMPPPNGGTNLPDAIQHARVLLDSSQRSGRDIIVLTDGQREGWVDPTAMLRWDLLSTQDREERMAGTELRDPPRLFVVNVDPDRKESPPNYAVAPLRANRPVVPVGREVLFRSDIMLSTGTKYEQPHLLRLEVDGRTVRNLETPRTAELKQGKVPFSFKHRFQAPGSHLVTVRLEPDLPVDDRKEGYQLKDTIPSDNRRDFALDVVTALPVLLVDGDPAPALGERGTDFLRDALAPENDPNPVVQVQTTSIADFTPEMLTGPRGALPPRVVVFNNVAQLSRTQSDAIARFLAAGGGVLVVLGDRVNGEAYNKDLYREGRGWLPARVDEVQGDVDRPEDGIRPVPSTSTHPVLDLFRDELGIGGLGAARFPRWWKVSTPGQDAPGVTVASLRSAREEHAFLVERFFQSGRVLLSTVPLDDTWESNLPRTAAFVPLVHEMVYYLAGARSSDFNLQPGQPIRYPTHHTGQLSTITLSTPSGLPRPLTAEPTTGDSAHSVQVVEGANGSLVVFDKTREPGLYTVTAPQRVLVLCKPDEAQQARDAGADYVGGEEMVRKIRDESKMDFDVLFVTTAMLSTLETLEPILKPRNLYPSEASGRILRPREDWKDAIALARNKTTYYVVQPAAGESDLTPSTKEERDQVAKLVQLAYENNPDAVLGSMEMVEERPHVWWWFLIGLLLFLCVEVWMTRRMAMQR
jgi:hypothetical protein